MSSYLHGQLPLDIIREIGTWSDVSSCHNFPKHNPLLTYETCLLLTDCYNFSIFNGGNVFGMYYVFMNELKNNMDQCILQKRISPTLIGKMKHIVGKLETREPLKDLLESYLRVSTSTLK